MDPSRKDAQLDMLRDEFTNAIDAALSKIGEDAVARHPTITKTFIVSTLGITTVEAGVIAMMAFFTDVEMDSAIEFGRKVAADTFLMITETRREKSDG